MSLPNKEKDVIEASGIVTEIHKGSLFTVKAEIGGNTIEVKAKPSGKIRQNNIELVIGDNVSLELSPYDLTKGRITYRNNNYKKGR